jgi:hypothetical protein
VAGSPAARWRTGAGLPRALRHSAAPGRAVQTRARRGTRGRLAAERRPGLRSLIECLDLCWHAVPFILAFDYKSCLGFTFGFRCM